MLSKDAELAIIAHQHASRSLPEHWPVHCRTQFIFYIHEIDQFVKRIQKVTIEDISRRLSSLQAGYPTGKDGFVVLKHQDVINVLAEAKRELQEGGK